MKNSKGQELPQPYLDLAIMRREQYEGVGDDISMTDCFIWRETCEKFSWWYAVNKGETPEIPAASIAELGAWRKSREENKQSDFWGKAAMVADELRPEPDYKAMYECAITELKNIRALIGADENESTYDEVERKFIQLSREAVEQSSDRNWVAECAMRVYTNAGINLHDGIAESWEFAQKWAAEGKKRGHIV